MLLVAGGHRDPNLRAVIEAAKSVAVDVFPLLFHEGTPPSATWTLDSNELRIGGKRLLATAAFHRYDVFGPISAPSRHRTHAWYDMLQGWMVSSPEIRVLNRPYIGRRTLKLEILLLARAMGLRIPDTLASNELDRVCKFHHIRNAIVKPVGGGGYCHSLEDLVDSTELRDGLSACPAIVQERVRGPDVRIYIIGNKCLGFQISSDKIDYRQAKRTQIKQLTDLPSDTIASLTNLMTTIGLEWAAADFKIDTNSGELVFLEINSNPMFSVFDAVVDGQISESILHILVKSF